MNPALAKLLARSKDGGKFALDALKDPRVQSAIGATGAGIGAYNLLKDDDPSFDDVKRWGLEQLEEHGGDMALGLLGALGLGANVYGAYQQSKNNRSR